MLTRTALALALMFVTGPAALAATAGPWDAGLKLVPSVSGGVVAVNHGRMAKHPHYTSMQSLTEGQGRATGMGLARRAGLTPGVDFERTLSFEVGLKNEAVFLLGKLDGAKLLAFAKTSMAAGFEEGTHMGGKWFRVAPGQQGAILGKGIVAIAPDKLMETVLEVAARKKKALPSRQAYSALLRKATKDSPPMWSISWVTPPVKRRLERGNAPELAKVKRTVARITGTGDLTFEMSGETSSAAEAKAATKVVRKRIDETIAAMPLLKILGVAALADRIELTTKGSTAQARLKLNEAQVGLLTKTGGQVLGMFKR